MVGSALCTGYYCREIEPSQHRWSGCPVRVPVLCPGKSEAARGPSGPVDPMQRGRRTYVT